jgi:hypothetical protein
MFLGLLDPYPDPLIKGTYGSEDPDPHSDSYQNVMGPERWILRYSLLLDKFGVDYLR